MNRAVEPLQVAVDDKDEVGELLPPGECDRAERLGLIRFAIAEEGPDLAVLRVGDPPVLEVASEARLVDGHDRPQAHRDGRELPEVGHQPGMGIGREPALGRNLLAEAFELSLGDPPLEEGARVDPGRRMPLDVDEVAPVLLGGRMPEVVEAGLVQKGRGLEGSDVATQLGRFLVRAQDHRNRVPADQRADAALHGGVAGDRRLFGDRNRVDVRSRPDVLDRGSLEACPLDHSLDQVVGAARPIVLHDGIEGLEPLLSLDCIDVGHRIGD